MRTRILALEITSLVFQLGCRPAVAQMPAPDLGFRAPVERIALMNAVLEARETVYGQKMRASEVPADFATATMMFDGFRPESTEFIPPPMSVTPRPSGLVVVRVVVGGPNRLHVEEWVMREGIPGRWRAVTIRVFGIGGS